MLPEDANTDLTHYKNQTLMISSPASKLDLNQLSKIKGSFTLQVRNFELNQLEATKIIFKKRKNIDAINNSDYLINIKMMNKIIFPKKLSNIVDPSPRNSEGSSLTFKFNCHEFITSQQIEFRLVAKVSNLNENGQQGGMQSVKFDV